MSNITITDRQVAKRAARIQRERLAFAASCNDGMNLTTRAVAFGAAYGKELTTGSVAGLALFILGSYLGMI